MKTMNLLLFSESNTAEMINATAPDVPAWVFIAAVLATATLALGAWRMIAYLKYTLRIDLEGMHLERG